MKRIHYVLAILLLNSVGSNALAEERGERLYTQNCMVCHADDGGGAMPGVSDLSENRAWSTLSESKLIARLKQGIKTPGSPVSMPPKGGNLELTDADLQVIISYMRASFLK